LTAETVVAKSVEAMNAVSYSFKWHSVVSSGEFAGAYDGTWEVKAGQHADLLGQPLQGVVYSIANQSDSSDKCPGSTCIVIHAEGEYGQNGRAVLDVWVDKSTWRWVYRYWRSLNLEKTDRVIFA
jgi:hypothetical protein